MTGRAGSGGGRTKSGKSRPGTGGYGKRKLEGRGPTPPAEMRTGHPAQRRAAAQAKKAAQDKPVGRSGSAQSGSARTGATVSGRRSDGRGQDRVDVVLDQGQMDSMRSRIPGLDDDSGCELALYGKIPLEYIDPLGILLDELGPRSARRQ